MAAQAEALAALEAKHEEEWREFRERAETQRQGASKKKKTKTNRISIAAGGVRFEISAPRGVEELDGGDDAATVEEPVVVEDAAAKRREEEERIKSQKISQGRQKEV